MPLIYYEIVISLVDVCIHLVRGTRNGWSDNGPK